MGFLTNSPAAPKIARASEPPGAVPAAADTTARSTHMRKGATATDAVRPAAMATETSATAGIAAFSSLVLCVTPMMSPSVRRRIDPPAK